MALHERDHLLLDFERTWRFGSGAKAARIRAELGLAPTTYYRRLSELSVDPDAVAHDPLLMRRLQRATTERRRLRFEGPRFHQGSGK